MKHLHTFESFVNEAKLPSISLSKLSELPENTLVKVSLSQAAADSIKRDLKANGVKHEEESKTIILMNNTPKARTAIKLAIERFGIRSVMIDTQGTRIIEGAEGAIDEAVISVDTTSYRTTHGKEPRGAGKWAFRIGKEEMMTPTSMNYTEALKWAKGEAEKMKVQSVYVLG